MLCKVLLTLYANNSDASTGSLRRKNDNIIFYDKYFCHRMRLMNLKSPLFRQLCRFASLRRLNAIILGSSRTNSIVSRIGMNLPNKDEISQNLARNGSFMKLSYRRL